jgi:DNA-binding LytR/AlgR family response regulator
MNAADDAAPTALIAEDEPLLARMLAGDLARSWPELRVIASVADGDSALARTLALRPRIVFLDIRMPGRSGLDVAQALAEDWPARDAPFPLLVFITAYDEYAVQAFEREAVDYLLKPVDDARLAQCVARLQRALAQQRAAAPDLVLQHAMTQLRGLLGALPAAGVARLDVIQAAVGNIVHMVPIDEVIYFEAADKYLRVVTAERDYLIRLSLRELLPQLDAQRFWQVHRSTVVQARMIRSAQREESGKVTLTLRDRPEKLTASRLYAHLFRGL